MHLMRLRATMISLRDICYDTHKKWREKIVVYSGSIFVILSGSLLTVNISISKSVNKATEQCNLSTNQVDRISFEFLFTQTPIQESHHPTPLPLRQRIQMELTHSMTQGPWLRWYHTTLKDRWFNGFHSGVTPHIFNLSHNLLTHVTRILSDTKSLK